MPLFHLTFLNRIEINLSLRDSLNLESVLRTQDKIHDYTEVPN